MIMLHLASQRPPKSPLLKSPDQRNTSSSAARIQHGLAEVHASMTLVDAADSAQIGRELLNSAGDLLRAIGSERSSQMLLSSTSMPDSQAASLSNVLHAVGVSMPSVGSPALDHVKSGLKELFRSSDNEGLALDARTEKFVSVVLDMVHQSGDDMTFAKGLLADIKAGDIDRLLSIQAFPRDPVLRVALDPVVWHLAGKGDGADPVILSLTRELVKVKHELVKMLPKGKSHVNDLSGITLTPDLAVKLSKSLSDTGKFTLGYLLILEAKLKETPDHLFSAASLKPALHALGIDSDPARLESLFKMNIRDTKQLARVEAQLKSFSKQINCKKSLDQMIVQVMDQDLSVLSDKFFESAMASKGVGGMSTEHTVNPEVLGSVLLSNTKGRTEGLLSKFGQKIHAVAKRLFMNTQRLKSIEVMVSGLSKEKAQVQAQLDAIKSTRSKHFQRTGGVKSSSSHLSKIITNPAVQQAFAHVQTVSKALGPAFQETVMFASNGALFDLVKQLPKEHPGLAPVKAAISEFFDVIATELTKTLPSGEKKAANDFLLASRDLLPVETDQLRMKGMFLQAVMMDNYSFLAERLTKTKYQDVAKIFSNYRLAVVNERQGRGSESLQVRSISSVSKELTEQSRNLSEIQSSRKRDVASLYKRRPELQLLTRSAVLQELRDKPESEWRSESNIQSMVSYLAKVTEGKIESDFLYAMVDVELADFSGPSTVKTWIADIKVKSSDHEILARRRKAENSLDMPSSEERSTLAKREVTSWIAGLKEGETRDLNWGKTLTLGIPKLAMVAQSALSHGTLEVHPSLRVGRHSNMKLSREVSDQSGVPKVGLTLSKEMMTAFQLEVEAAEGLTKFGIDVSRTHVDGFKFVFDSDAAAARFLTQIRSGNPPDVAEAEIQVVLNQNGKSTTVGMWAKSASIGKLKNPFSSEKKPSAVKIGGVGIQGEVTRAHQVLRGYTEETVIDTMSYRLAAYSGSQDKDALSFKQRDVGVSRDYIRGFEQDVLTRCEMVDRLDVPDRESAVAALQSPEYLSGPLADLKANRPELAEGIQEMLGKIEPGDQIKIHYALKPGLVWDIAALPAGTSVESFLTDKANYDVTQVQILRGTGEEEVKNKKIDFIQIARESTVSAVRVVAELTI